MVTKKELYEKATELDIAGRSSMDKDELAAAIDEATGSTPEPVVDEDVEARREARRAEAAEADANRAENEAAAQAEIRTAAQQALDRKGGETREERRERKQKAREETKV